MLGNTIGRRNHQLARQTSQIYPGPFGKASYIMTFPYRPNRDDKFFYNKAKESFPFNYFTMIIYRGSIVPPSPDDLKP